MNVAFKRIGLTEFIGMVKDPYTFYDVYDDGDYTLQIGLYEDGILIKTWEELEEMGLDISSDYSDNPNDPNYYLNPDSGSAANVLDGNGLSGDLVIPNNTPNIGANAFADSQGLNSLTSPSNGNVSSGTVSLPDGLNSIGDNAFSGTQTSAANIPSTTSNVAPNAFSGTPAASNNGVNFGGHPIQPITINLEDEDSAEITLEKGYVYQITALYGFEDDVTHESTIESSDNNIVRFIPECFLKAENVGTAIISGTYIPLSGVKKYAEIICNIVDDGSGVIVHIPGDPVIENETFYSYDKVVYCKDTGIELSRETIMKEAGMYKPDGTFVSWEDLLNQGIISTNKNQISGSKTNEIQGVLIIPDTITNFYSSSVFSGCEDLSAIYLPDPITSIPYYTFSNCSGLTNVRLPSNLVGLSNYSFQGCSNLVSIEIPDGVTIIRDKAFYQCISLSSVKFPSNLKEIREAAFEYCSSLSSIDLPGTISEFYRWVFAYCTNLTVINYAGTKEKWNNITKRSEWRSGTPSIVVHCSDGDISL